VLGFGLGAVAAGLTRPLAPARAEPAAGRAPVPPLEVDIHCHTFCSADLPIVGFVAHYVPGLSDLSRELTRWPETVIRAILTVVATLPSAAAPTGGAEIATLQAAMGDGAQIGGVTPLPGPAVDDLIDRVLKPLPFSVGAETRRLFARYLDTLYMVAHPRAALSATLAETYPSVSLFVPSLVDYDAWSDDRAPTPLATQILVQELISRLSLRGRIGRPGARFHPFVAFDPRREVEARSTAAPSTPAAPSTTAAPPGPISSGSTAMEMVRYAIESAGFLGVKVYPAVGFAPFDNVRLRPREALSAQIDAALRAFYAYCEKEEVPITTHASAANEYALGLHTLVAPERWRPALASYPTMRLNFGHFGQDFGIDPRLGVRGADAWIRQAAALIEWYPNVYADLSNSAVAYDAAYAARFAVYLKEIVAAFPKVKKRLMYGSDWWLARLEPGSSSCLEAMRKLLSAHFRPEEVADIMGRNALRFLGFLDDENRPRPGRAARRLRRLYDATPAPVWLA
jgi:predicted TIM-barrel fold metal-dependent hydrolase